MTEMEMMALFFFFFASETLNVAKQEEGEIKAAELQMVHIDFHEN